MDLTSCHSSGAENFKLLLDLWDIYEYYVYGSVHR